MINILIGLLIGLLISVIPTYYLIRLKRKYNKIIDYTESGRYGIINVKGRGVIEFQEVCRAGESIKIDIIRVQRKNSLFTEKEILSEIKVSENLSWIKIVESSLHPDYYIEWFDNNSQMVRDKKISNLLKD